MTRVVYIEYSGNRIEADVAAGLSVMEGARVNNVAGIEAECGGSCSCSTCHVYVDPAWIDRLPAKLPMEEDILELAHDPDPALSRLSCQIEISDDLDGLTVRIPARQG